MLYCRIWPFYLPVCWMEFEMPLEMLASVYMLRILGSKWMNPLVNVNQPLLNKGHTIIGCRKNKWSWRSSFHNLHENGPTSKVVYNACPNIPETITVEQCLSLNGTCFNTQYFYFWVSKHLILPSNSANKRRKKSCLSHGFLCTRAKTRKNKEALACGLLRGCGRRVIMTWSFLYALIYSSFSKSRAALWRPHCCGRLTHREGKRV